MPSKSLKSVDVTHTLEVEAPSGNQTILIHDGMAAKPLADLLRRENLPLNTRCGQRGLCDGCLVELTGGTLIHRATGEPIHANGTIHTLRGCEYRVGEDALTQIRIPARSVLAYQPQVVTHFRINVPRAHDPLLQTLMIPARELKEIQAGGGTGFQPVISTTHGLEVHATAALLQVVHRLSPSHTPLRAAETIGQQLKAIEGALNPDSTLAATLEYRPDHWLLSDLALTDPAFANRKSQIANPPNPLGVAIDIGTTTVALLVVDLVTGEVLSQAASFNRQMHMGDDVVTRINLCTTDPSNLQTLQQAVIAKTINPLLTEAVDKAGLSPQRIACYSVSGNTTMLHLFAGVDPTSLGVAPFTAAFLNHRIDSARSLHLHPTVHHAPGTEGGRSPHHDPTAHLLAGAAAYVGADITAGVLSSGLVYDEGPSLLVDVGTNGEIVLKHGQKMFGCATAAGPAFEGAGLTAGMRAGHGAISHIRFSTKPFSIETEIIEGTSRTKPSGLCGSAYVDFLAEARRTGLISTTGRFDLDAVPDAAAHIVDSPHGRGLRIALAQGHQDLLVTEQDVAKLLQAKAAIAAGILTLLARAGLAAEQIKTLYLAGGFGMHMHLPSAVGCGLLPGFKLDQIQLVGNTALAGAYLSLLDSGAAAELERIGQQIEIVELNLDPEFEFRYIDQLSLPEM